jgi:hypothetical protein
MTTSVNPIPRARKAGTWYVVRDARGEIRHTGRTKRDALAPYIGSLTKTEVKGRRRGVMPDAPTLRKSRVWLFLFRHG